MRKSAKNFKTINLERVQRYHEGGTDENYAFNGFKARKYFTSDRTIPLSELYERQDGKPLKGYGLEIETECESITTQTVYAEVFTKIIMPLFPKDLFKLQNDGSLMGRSSAECITQPMTKEFIRNNYSAFQAMYDRYFPAFKIDCATSGNCGMHVNISVGNFGKLKKNQDIAIRKFYYLINKRFNFCCELFRRKADRTGFCRPVDVDIAYCKELNLEMFPNDHGRAINLGHYNNGRIELRIVGGQPNYSAFRNTMETVFFLIERVKTLSWEDVDDVTKVFAGCNQYVFQRLSRIMDDESEEYEKIEQTVERENLL